MSQILHKPSMHNPRLKFRAGEAEQITMRRSGGQPALYQKETVLLFARLEGYVNVEEAGQLIYNIKLTTVHWPGVIENGEIADWPSLGERERTLIALQEGYRDLLSFEEWHKRPKAPELDKLFIQGKRTKYWHKIDPKQIRPHKQQ